MEKIIVKVNNVLIDCEVPKLTNRQLSRMIEATVKLIDGEYQIILSIPIVKRDVFTSYFTAPMPNAAINMIPDFDDHTIIINERNNLGIDATTAMEKSNQNIFVNNRRCNKILQNTNVKRLCSSHTYGTRRKMYHGSNSTKYRKMDNYSNQRCNIFCLILDKLLSLPTEENNDQHYSWNHPCTRRLLHRNSKNNNQDDEGKIINFKNYHQATHPHSC